MPDPYYSDDLVTIYCGDALEILPELSPETFGVMLTDPPYGMSYTAGSREGWSSRWAGVEIAGDHGTEARDAALSWRGDRPALVFGTWKVTPPDQAREMLVWDKVVSTGLGALDVPWRPSWEGIYVLGRGWDARRGHGVLRYSLPTRAPDRKWHPTPKPVDLLRDLLSKSPEGPVIDPFAGAGSTLRAALDLGRRAVGIELEESYCEIAVERCAQMALDLTEEPPR